MQQAGSVEVPTLPHSHTSDSLASTPLSKNVKCGICAMLVCSTECSVGSVLVCCSTEHVVGFVLVCCSSECGIGSVLVCCSGSGGLCKPAV